MKTEKKSAEKSLNKILLSVYCRTMRQIMIKNKHKNKMKKKVSFCTFFLFTKNAEQKSIEHPTHRALFNS